jgi:Zn-dependent protease with chaperone function
MLSHMGSALGFIHKFFLGVLFFLIAWLALSLLNLPWIAFLSAFSWKAAILGAGVVGLSTVIVFVFLPEWGIAKLLHGQVPRTHGLRNSYERAHRAFGRDRGRRPALVTYPDPVPNVFVVRSITGSGMILLSDGLISLLDESEMHFVLSRAIRHLHSPEVYVQTGCILVLLFLQEKMPFHSGSYTPLGALGHWVVFPWAQTFRGIAASSVTKRVGSDQDISDFARGASKISRAERLYGQQALLPGLVYLGLQR